MGDGDEEGYGGDHFVLVHGASHGAWCWFKLRWLLESSGRRVSAIDLAGAGIDLTNPDSIQSFDDYNRPLLALLSALPDGDKVILVGHSAGGLSVVQAIHLFVDKIKLAIFVAARLLTTDRLIKRGWHGPSFCVLCYGDEESLDHLLFRCCFARSVWQWILQGKLYWLSTWLHGTGDLATNWERVKRITARSDQDYLDACIAATCWELWVERNRRIFDNKTNSSGQCGRRIINNVTQWGKALGE